MEDVTVFRELYEGVMTEVEASGFYHFPAAYYANLNAALGRNVMQLHVCTPEGEVVAAALLMRHDNMLHYHLSCASALGKQLGATHFMWGFIVEYAIREGITLVHLGGGVHEGDSLEKFKRSFGNTRHTYYVGQWVTDPIAFAQLNMERARLGGLDVLPSSTWFPPYRMSL
jgi:lipid II:glycine glycyltransferase (peptidoglycan interpeptide bridge formation enzyme)